MPTADASEHRKQAEAALTEAERLPPGPERDQLLSKAKKIEDGARSDRWRGSSLHAPD